MTPGNASTGPAFPTRLRVGSAFYQVRYLDRRDAEARGINGECFPNERTIDVQDDLPLDLKLEVLMHEALHATIFESQLTDLPECKVDLLQKSGHEFVVSWAATAYQRILFDNPDLLRLIREVYYSLAGWPSGPFDGGSPVPPYLDDTKVS